MDESLQIEILVERFDLAGLRDLRNKIHDAVIGRVQLPLQINQRSRDGSSSSAILVSSFADAEAMLRALQGAIREVDPDATTAVRADRLSSSLDLSYRPVHV